MSGRVACFPLCISASSSFKLCYKLFELRSVRIRISWDQDELCSETRAVWICPISPDRVTPRHAKSCTARICLNRTILERHQATSSQRALNRVAPYGYLSAIISKLSAFGGSWKPLVCLALHVLTVKTTLCTKTQVPAGHNASLES